METISKEVGISYIKVRNKMIEFGFERRPRAEHKIGTKLSRKTLVRIKEGLKGKNFQEDNKAWKGGLRLSGGYVYIYVSSRVYIKRSILVMEHMIGRKLKQGELVHHKGVNYPVNSKENKLDDTEENLQLCENREEHCAIHNILRGQM